jgi:hypothetical protein
MARAASLSQSGEWMVICSNGQAIALQIGPDGEPVAPNPFCPDCALHLTASLPEIDTKPLWDETPRSLALSFAPTIQASRRLTPNHARDPPFAV